MNNTLFYTLPQWFIFSAIFASVYGWIENKRIFRIIGAIIFVFLSIFSLVILSGDYFTTALPPTTNETVSEIPFQAKLFPAYLSFVFSGVLAIAALFFDIKKSNRYRWFIILAGLIALFGFFVITGALKTF